MYFLINKIEYLFFFSYILEVANMSVLSTRVFSLIPNGEIHRAVDIIFPSVRPERISARKKNRAQKIRGVTLFSQPTVRPRRTFRKVLAAVTFSARSSFSPPQLSASCSENVVGTNEKNKKRTNERASERDEEKERERKSKREREKGVCVRVCVKKKSQPDACVFLFYRDVPPRFAREGGGGGTI
ncbi:hypothetical protein PUN28_017682 [Cardiocondyla obscurior]|uniref:Uncharacterized protein n=1 Tax=Cardiocondyla obscurior TaxID=286306 RepID=A0AAW2EJQ5_9HYME